MNNPIRIAALSELAEEKPAAARADGVDLVVVRSGDRVSACEGWCPHQGTSLAEGSVDQGVLTCRGHGWRFDCESGARVDAPGTGLRTFATRIENDAVLVDGDELLAWRKRREEKAAVDPPGLRPLAELPGPKGLPLLGNLLQVHLDRLHLELEGWAAQYGPIFTFTLARKPIVAIGDSDAMLAILRDRPDGYRRLSAIQAVNRELGIVGVFSSEGDDWRRQRGLVTEGLDPPHVRRFFPGLLQITERLKNRWLPLAASGQPFDLHQDLVRFTVDVTTNFVFDCDMNMLERGEEEFQRHLSRILPAVNRRVNAPVPYWRYLKLPADRAVDRAVTHLATVCRQFIAQARERLVPRSESAPAPRNLLENLLAAHDADHGRLTENEIFGNTITMLLAGEDTTANTLAWMIHLLAQHPEVLRRIRAEIESVAGQDGELSDSRQLDELPYLEAVIHETLRLKSPVPLLFLETDRRVAVGGVELPEGTALMLLLRFPCMQEQNFTAARAFQPERWLSPRDTTKFPAHNRGAWVPFGAGPRFCPGRYLSWLETKTAAAMIFRHFDPAPMNDAGPASERFGFTMMPSHSRFRLTPCR